MLMLWNSPERKFNESFDGKFRLLMLNEELVLIQMDLFLRYSPHNEFFYPLMEFVHLIVVYATNDFRIEKNLSMNISITQ